MITTVCHSCGKVFKLRDETAGKEGKCSCGAVISIPRNPTPSARVPHPAIQLERNGPADTISSAYAPTSIVKPESRRTKAWLLLGIPALCAAIGAVAWLSLRGEAPTDTKPAAELHSPALAAAPASPVQHTTAPAKPNSLALKGTPEELKRFGFLALYDEADLPKHFAGYLAILEDHSRRLTDEGELNQETKTISARAFRPNIGDPDVVKTNSLVAPYLARVNGSVLVSVIADRSLTRLSIKFSLEFEVRTDETNHLRSWVLKSVEAEADNGAGGKTNMNGTIRPFFEKAAVAAIDDVLGFMKRQQQP